MVPTYTFPLELFTFYLLLQSVMIRSNWTYLKTTFYRSIKLILYKCYFFLRGVLFCVPFTHCPCHHLPMSYKLTGFYYTTEVISLSEPTLLIYPYFQFHFRTYFGVHILKVLLWYRIYLTIPLYSFHSIFVSNINNCTCNSLFLYVITNLMYERNYFQDYKYDERNRSMGFRFLHFIFGHVLTITGTHVDSYRLCF